MSIAPYNPEDGDSREIQLPPSALESITRAEIDIQIATANRFPRSLSKFLQEAKSIVALDVEVAGQCTYVLPKRKGADKSIQGPSVRLAEIMASCYRNLRISGRITDDDGRMITAQGVALDLERNVGYSVEVKRGVMSKEGWRYSDDMIKVTCQAAISIATRNATFKVIPRTFVNLVEEEAKKVFKRDVKNLPARIDEALRWFKEKGVAPKQIFTTLGIGGPVDIDLDILAELSGYRTSIIEGLATVSEIFPIDVPRTNHAPATPDSAPSTKTNKLLDKLKPETPPPAKPDADKPKSEDDLLDSAFGDAKDD